MEQGLSNTGTGARERAKGLVIINTGTGKGKTTAALGLLFRAWGWDMKVIMLQFMKSTTANYGEHRAARRLGIEIVPLGAGFTWQTTRADKGRSLAIDLWGQAREKITSGNYDMVVLDELSYPLQYGWIPVEAVLETLRNRLSWVHVVITGRDTPQELIDFADIVTNMEAVKHPFQEGTKAQPGIEF
jgi:cob(I)alamin adenosyltransferase